MGTTKTVGAGTVIIGAARRRAEVAVTEELDETLRVARRHAEGGGGAGRRGKAAATVREDDTVDAGVMETAKPPERSKRVAIAKKHLALALALGIT